MWKTGNSRIDDSTAPWVVASDECGLGSWAGPLYVTAVALPREWTDSRVTDSKDLTPKQREAIHDEFEMKCLNSIVIVNSWEIDKVGMRKALLDAHGKALRMTLQAVRQKWSGDVLIVVDGNMPAPPGVSEAISLPKADSLVPACSLASIIGKVAHDRHMAELAKTYPGYGFSRNQGYGTPEHKEGLRKLGPCEIHRKSYSPIKKALKAMENPEEDLFESIGALIDSDDMV